MKQESERIRLYGIVQGVGFRPFVRRTADRFGICGTVCNRGSFVEVYASGSRKALDGFFDVLIHQPPPRAVVLKTDRETIQPFEASRFRIIASEKEEGDIFVSPDIATCPKCRQELFDPSNRRYLHPFINCTACGPRMTILDGMPYDRERTSMKKFPMCPQCEYEYTHPHTRRYDAQPVCCNDCGPRVYLLHPEQDIELPVRVDDLPDDETDAAAITAARKTIAAGGIVAVKGIGGFHLCCNAADEQAVARLRERKHRPQKPFAVMMKNLKTVRRECQISASQEEVLDGHQKPIILLRRRQESALAPSVAPDNPTVGVMLPYAPLQMLLFTYNDDVEMPDCFVMTSGNISGAPICRDDRDAMTELKDMCDLILSHNRLIRLRADDSVMDFFEDKPYMIRRSRGYAPLPFLRDTDCSGTILAVGGELKNTFCIARHHLYYLSPYIGDMADIRTVQALEESTERMEHLLEAEPELVACDMHPQYNTTAFAKKLGLPVVEVQHHYAHILSCMAENEYEDRVIGIAFDGTGYGTDGTIWGGEILLSDCRGFTRLGSIEPFAQPGGDASAREGWRIAVSLLYGVFRDQDQTRRYVQQFGLCDEKNLKMQFLMADQGINRVTSTSAGRLFDAVSALLGIRNRSTFEGEASMALQFAAEAFEESGSAPECWETVADDAALEWNTAEDDRFLLPTTQLYMDLAKSRLNGGSASELAWVFHRKLADLVTSACIFARGKTGLDTVALSGGVFQNRLLLKMCVDSLRRRGFRVLLHSMVPPNDGGIALGQAVAAMEEYNRRKSIRQDAEKTRIDSFQGK